MSDGLTRAAQAAMPTLAVLLMLGLVSAVSSGAATIGIPLHLTLHEGPTHELWPSLAGRGVDDLSAALARHQHRATGVVS